MTVTLINLCLSILALILFIGLVITAAALWHEISDIVDHYKRLRRKVDAADSGDYFD